MPRARNFSSNPKALCLSTRLDKFNQELLYLRVIRLTKIYSICFNGWTVPWTWGHGTSLINIFFRQSDDTVAVHRGPDKQQSFLALAGPLGSMPTLPAPKKIAG
jgi:hypothetical protein